MTAWLISFPSGAMDVAEADLPAVAAAARAVVAEAKAAGVLIFAGGIDETVAPVRIAGCGTHLPDLYPRGLDGGFMVIDTATRDAALDWARRVATACRCPQELRAFMPEAGA